MIWLIRGILVGFAFALLIGPLFFIYLQSCVKRGTRYGVIVAAGAWLSDLLLIIVINLGVLILMPKLNLARYDFLLYTLGGLVLLIIGFQMYFVKSRNDQAEESSDPHAKLPVLNYMLLGKGFIVNLLNPAVIFYWFGLSFNMSFREKVSATGIVLFFTGALIIRIAMDLLKIRLGRTLGIFLQEGKLLWFQRISGIVLACIGIALLTTAWSHAIDVFSGS